MEGRTVVFAILHIKFHIIKAAIACVFHSRLRCIELFYPLFLPSSLWENFPSAVVLLANT